jgi:predicted esterase
LVDAGYDVDLVTVPGGHDLPPGSFATWIDTIVQTAQET